MLTRQTLVFTYTTWVGDSLNDYNWFAPKKATIVMELRTRNYTDTVKRFRPLDGYQLATSRSTVSTLYNTAIMDWCTNPRGTKYTNYPLWQMYPRSSSRFSDYAMTKPLSEPTTSLDREAMYNAIRKDLKHEATNLANMLGEYAETAETFLQLTEAVLSRGKSLLRRHKSGRKRGKVAVGSTVASNHLAWTYGIKPLAGDLGTAVAELRSAVYNYPRFTEGVLVRHDRNSNSGYRATNSTTFVRPADSQVIVETRYRTQWRAYFNTNALVAVLADHGMLNPLSLAWELMPYSFVLDWFFSVGDVLSSLDNLLICDKLMALDSTSVKTYEYCRPRVDDRMFLAQQGFYYNRTDNRRTAVEIPRVSSLSYKPSLSVGHILNGLALLHVAAKRL
jgi:hypothetical protein